MDAPTRLPEKPSIDGIEERWMAVWEEQGTYLFDRTKTREQIFSIDHVRFLGSTVEQIAAEKAGVLKAGSFGVLAQQEVAVSEVLLRRAAEVAAPLFQKELRTR